MKMLIYEYEIKIILKSMKGEIMLKEKMKKISAMIRVYMHIHLELDIMLKYYALYDYIYSSTIL